MSMALTSRSVSLSAAVTMKSSAYLTRFTFFVCHLPFVPLGRLEGNRLLTSRSMPSRVTLASVGEMIPPCGVPSVVGVSRRL